MVCSADEEVADWEGGRQRGWMGDAIYAKDRLRLLGFLKVLRESKAVSIVEALERLRVGGSTVLRLRSG